MSTLFSPIEVKQVKFANRVVMPPMVTGKSATDGTVTTQILDHYGQRAQAGTGLVIVEATYVDPGGRCWERGLGAASDRHKEGLAALATRIRDGGSVAAIQLVHGGPQASAAVSGSATVGPSAPDGGDTTQPRSLSVEQIRAIERRFAEAAARAITAGFDGVEVHGAHGFLLDSFLMKSRNRRTDEYGGDIAGRMRMLVETCRSIRSAIPDRALLICRISIFNKRDEGFTQPEFEQLVSGLANAGTDVLHISTDGAFRGYFGTRRSIGRSAKSICNLPVIVAGGLGKPADAERAVAGGHCDLAAVGRAMFDDPQWTAKAREALS